MVNLYGSPARRLNAYVPASSTSSSPHISAEEPGKMPSFVFARSCASAWRASWQRMACRIHRGIVSDAVSSTAVLRSDLRTALPPYGDGQDDNRH